MCHGYTVVNKINTVHARVTIRLCIALTWLQCTENPTSWEITQSWENWGD